MTKEDFEARISMAYEGREQWDAFLDRVWSIHTSELAHWISVEDELPKKREDVLVFTSQKSIQIAQLRYPETADWWDNDGRYMQNNKPTHWMPMPQPPIVSKMENTEKKGGAQ